MYLQPSTRTSRPDLQGVSLAYDILNAGLISHIVARPLIVPTQNGVFDKIPLGPSTQLPKTSRGSDGHYNRVPMEMESGSWNCKESGLEAVIDHAKRAARPNVDLETFRARQTAAGILRRAEATLAALLINETNFVCSGDTGLTTSTRWDDATNSTAAADVATGKDSIKRRTGVPGEKCHLMIPHAVAMKIPFTAEYRNRMQITSKELGANATLQQLATHFGVERVVIGQAQYNGADYGLAASLSNFWNEDYAFLYLPRRGDSIEEIHCASTFMWDESGMINQHFPGVGEPGDMASLPYAMESYDDPTVRGDVVRAFHHVDAQIVNASAGYLIKNIKT